MEHRHFYIRIIIFMLLLVGFSGLGVFLYMQETSLILLGIIGLIIIVSGYQILHAFDKIQYKIAYFFNAVENEDSTLYFSENIAHHPTRALHKSLNRINLLIQEAKIKNQEQEQYFAALLETVTTGIVVINANGNILQSNSAAKTLLNYNTLTHIMQLKRVDEKLYDAFASLKEHNRQLVKLSLKNATTQLALQATDFHSRNQTFILESIQDIRKELDTNEIEAWQKLIRVLTHEIMNSITPITSLSDTLLGYYTNPNMEISSTTNQNTVKGLEVIKERGQGLIHFVESYRKLTRLSIPQLKPISVKPLVEHLWMLVKEESATNIHFSLEITPEDLIIDADENQISQVLINLLKNAIQAVESKANPSIKIRAGFQAHRPQIAIIDNGTGISEAVQEQIFIPFFTTKENGSGIGLSISRQIMRNHGGNIRLVSQPEVGSQFVLEF